MSTLSANFWKLAKEIQAVSGALAWFPADAPFVHLTSGNVDTWHDIAQRYTLTDQGVAGNRPAWDGSNPADPFLNFAGASVLAGATSVLSGRADCTVVAVMESIATVGTGYQICYVEPAAGYTSGGMVIYTLGSALPANFIAKNGTTYNQQSLTALSAGKHVLVCRQRFSDGTNGATIIRVDGANGSSTHTYTADVTGGSYPAGDKLAVGGSSGGGVQAKLKVRDVLIAPYLSDAKADYVQQCFKALRGTP